MRSRPDMAVSTSTNDGASARPVSVVIRPPERRVSLNLRELWAYRELFYFLAWRDVKVRYKQTGVGIAWAVIQPLATMVVFSIFFGHLAQVPSDGVPYPIFVFCALIPWQLFVYALTESGKSLVTNQALVTKVYFPRLIVPLSASLAGVVDFLISFGILGVLMAYYGIVPTAAVLLLPLFVLLAVATALAVGLWLSALNVEYRDVQYMIPFITQFWMLLTPIAYSASLIPQKLRWLYGLNPMAGVVTGFRWALLGTPFGGGGLLAASALCVVLLFVGGLFHFRRLEQRFADVI